jgi:hypothetical protein
MGERLDVPYVPSSGVMHAQWVDRVGSQQISKLFICYASYVNVLRDYAHAF